jgi:hypothetical protein
MSPILFNVIADMLAVLIGRAKEDGQVCGLIPHLVEGGVSILSTQMIQLSSWNMIWQKLEI